MLDFSKPWTEFEFIAFDTETSGAYPLGSEVVEFGAVRWKAGKEISSYQTLLKPSRPMSDFIIGIHGITNEMVEDAPLMKDKISEIREFLNGAILMAHHAPFDLGFMMADFERYNVNPPTEPVLCTSLLARKLIPESHNHKLQTLITHLGLERGSAHRAKDDARACLNVGLECMNRMGSMTALQEVFDQVGKKLDWNSYRLRDTGNPTMDKIIECLEENLSLDIAYQGGTKGEEMRRITPQGIVRNPDGDYVMAKCHRDVASKRFYIDKIKDAAVVY
jgi:DNA polymerase-3 subunit epsilon